MKVFKRIKLSLFDSLAIIFILFTSPLFFYKLGQTSLVSWDEAWYAEIARNILRSHNFINLTWNGNPYFDHPPTGFWLMAATFKIFGVSEFWARFPSAIAGITSIVLLYLLGKKIFNPLVGLSSAAVLSSAIWFIFRSRSGNLDTILTMFFLLTFLLAIKAAESKKYLLPFIVSLSLLFLTKTMVPFTIVPPLLLIFYRNKLYKLKDLILPALLLLGITCGWFISQTIQYPNFLQNYIGVGLRGANLEPNYLENLKLTKDYLYNSIGRWFWPGILSLILSILLKEKRFFIFIVFFISFTLPIVFSPKIQIWHLIPLSPILIMIFFGFTFTFLERYQPKLKYHFYAAILIISAFIYINQIKMIWYQFIDIPAFISDEAILSKESAKYHEPLIVDGEYRPAALFYSGKGIIEQAPKDDEYFTNLFKSKDNFLLITNKWRLEKLNVKTDNYTLIKEDRDKVLVLRKAQ